MKYYHIKTNNICMLPVLLTKRGLAGIEMACFKHLFSAFIAPLKSDYYRVMTMSDTKYNLTIRKDIFDTYNIKFTIQDYGETFR